MIHATNILYDNNIDYIFDNAMYYLSFTRFLADNSESLLLLNRMNSIKLRLFDCEEV